MRWKTKKRDERDEVKTGNSVKWKWFIMPLKVEHINDNLFYDTYKK
jgi:hypothetical protein